MMAGNETNHLFNTFISKPTSTKDPMPSTSIGTALQNQNRHWSNSLWSSVSDISTNSSSVSSEKESKSDLVLRVPVKWASKFTSNKKIRADVTEEEALKSLEHMQLEKLFQYHMDPMSHPAYNSEKAAWDEVMSTKNIIASKSAAKNLWEVFFDKIIQDNLFEEFEQEKARINQLFHEQRELKNVEATRYMEHSPTIEYIHNSPIRDKYVQFYDTEELSRSPIRTNRNQSSSPVRKSSHKESKNLEKTHHAFDHENCKDELNVEGEIDPIDAIDILKSLPDKKLGEYSLPIQNLYENLVLYVEKGGNPLEFLSNNESEDLLENVIIKLSSLLESHNLSILQSIIYTEASSGLTSVIKKIKKFKPDILYGLNLFIIAKATTEMDCKATINFIKTAVIYRELHLSEGQFMEVYLAIKVLHTQLVESTKLIQETKDNIKFSHLAHNKMSLQMDSNGFELPTKSVSANIDSLVEEKVPVKLSSLVEINDSFSKLDGFPNHNNTFLDYLTSASPLSSLSRDSRKFPENAAQDAKISKRYLHTKKLSNDIECHANFPDSIDASNNIGNKKHSQNNKPCSKTIAASLSEWLENSLKDCTKPENHLQTCTNIELTGQCLKSSVDNDNNITSILSAKTDTPSQIIPNYCSETFTNNSKIHSDIKTGPITSNESIDSPRVHTHSRSPTICSHRPNTRHTPSPNNPADSHKIHIHSQKIHSHSPKTHSRNHKTHSHNTHSSSNTHVSKTHNRKTDTHNSETRTHVPKARNLSPRNHNQSHNTKRRPHSPKSYTDSHSLKTQNSLTESCRAGKRLPLRSCYERPRRRSSERNTPSHNLKEKFQSSKRQKSGDSTNVALLNESKITGIHVRRSKCDSSSTESDFSQKSCDSKSNNFIPILDGTKDFHSNKDIPSVIDLHEILGLKYNENDGKTKMPTLFRKPLDYYLRNKAFKNLKNLITFYYNNLGLMSVSGLIQVYKQYHVLPQHVRDLLDDHLNHYDKVNPTVVASLRWMIKNRTK